MTGDRILITASRTWENRPLMEKKLGPWFSFDNVLVSGHCKTGGDAMAEQVWADWLGFSVSAAIFGGYIEIHPADWEKYGKRPAGFIRNAEMVKLGARKCLAFACMCRLKDCRGVMARTYGLPHYTHGTLHCGAHALKAGIDTEWIEDA